MEPQDHFFGVLRHACFFARRATRRVVAALVNDVSSWRVYFGRMLGHLNHLLVGPTTHSINLRSHDVLADSLEDRCCEK